MSAIEASDDQLLNEPRLSEEHGVALRVAQIAAPVLRDIGFRLVRVRLTGQDGATLQIMVERPDGTLNVEDCEAISDALSPVLDVEDPIKQAYRLEISSPGIDRPLMRASDFRRAIGFEAKIELSEMLDGRKRFRGRIDSVGADGVVALTRFDAKPGEPEAVQFGLAGVAEGRLVLTDDLIRETLRAAKTARQAGDLDADDDVDPAQAAPAKGPGRFANRNTTRQSKSRPVLPAGVQGGFKPRSKPNPAQIKSSSGVQRPR